MSGQHEKRTSFKITINVSNVGTENDVIEKCSCVVVTGIRLQLNTRFRKHGPKKSIAIAAIGTVEDQYACRSSDAVMSIPSGYGSNHSTYAVPMATTNFGPTNHSMQNSRLSRV